MIELKQGNVEAFRFNIRKASKPRTGRIAAFRVPSDRALFVSRYLDAAVLVLALIFFFRAADHLRLFEALWSVQMAHLVVKFAWVWKPVRIDISRPYETRPPRFTLAVEHSGFLVTLCTLEMVFIVHDVGSDLLWMVLATITIVLMVLDVMRTPHSMRWR